MEGVRACHSGRVLKVDQRLLHGGLRCSGRGAGGGVREEPAPAALSAITTASQSTRARSEEATFGPPATYKDDETRNRRLNHQRLPAAGR